MVCCWRKRRNEGETLLGEEYESLVASNNDFRAQINALARENKELRAALTPEQNAAIPPAARAAATPDTGAEDWTSVLERAMSRVTIECDAQERAIQAAVKVATAQSAERCARNRSREIALPHHATPRAPVPHLAPQCAAAHRLVTSALVQHSLGPPSVHRPHNQTLRARAPQDERIGALGRRYLARGLRATAPRVGRAAATGARPALRRLPRRPRDR